MVKVSSDTAEILLKRSFDRIINGCVVDRDCVLLEDFLGEVNELSISRISEAVENKLPGILLSKNLLKKTFAILIEGLQNIYKHALRDDDNQSVGGFVCLNTNEFVQLHFLNLVDQESIKGMSAFCDRLNVMSLEEIKVMYMDTLNNSNLTDKGGASLGCLLMKFKSDGNLSYKFEAVEKGISCFHLMVKIMK